jgi:hypothetical protein
LAPRGKPFPQAIIALGRLAGSGDRVRFHGRGEYAPEAVIVKAREELAQGIWGKFIRLENCGAKLGAGSTKEAEIRLAIVWRTKRVEFICDCHDGQPVGIVQCHSKPQNCELPGT